MKSNQTMQLRRTATSVAAAHLSAVAAAAADGVVSGSWSPLGSAPAGTAPRVVLVERIPATGAEKTNASGAFAPAHPSVRRSPDL